MPHEFTLPAVLPSHSGEPQNWNLANYESMWMSHEEWLVSETYAAEKIKQHPFFLKAINPEGVSIQEIRAHLLSYLHSYETWRLCGNCPSMDRRAKAVGITYEEGANPGCCEGCPLWKPKVGCGSRSTACLGYSCQDLNTYLLHNGGLFEFRHWRLLFRWGLDSIRSGKRIPDNYRYRLIEVDPAVHWDAESTLPYAKEQIYPNPHFEEEAHG